MLPPEISPQFTVEDIHKIREYNYELTKDMSVSQRREYYKKGADIISERIREARRRKQIQNKQENTPCP